MSDCPTISIIIPCYNAQATLQRCLAGIERQSDLDFEVVLVDNGSQDATLEILRDWAQQVPFAVQVVEESKKGASAARNAGIRAARGGWIAFTDSDCVPDDDWIAQGRPYLDREVALAGPAPGSFEGDLPAKLVGLTSLVAGLKPFRWDRLPPQGVSGFPTANFWAQRDILLEIGGFDEALAPTGEVGEDFDVCVKILRGYGPIFFDPAVRVRHIHPPGMRELWVKGVRYGRSHPRLFARYGQVSWILEGPGGRTLAWGGGGPRLWVQFQTADKKLVLLLLLGLFEPWLFCLVPLYGFWIARFLKRRAQEFERQLNWGESWAMAGLLIVRSLAMTVGRIQASRGEGVFTC
ncbi:MAG: hypothetical protein AUJ55_02770 [Proteobacteria bacterium CG1_02_64_396]|nr:MAG: hypothetical protein AUJ55_02770 [Proteobacteria bacterium CG1_02_64_396]